MVTPKFLLDTDICIFALRRPSERLSNLFQSNAVDLSVSAVTAFELYYGAARSAKPGANRTIVQQFLGRLPVVPFDTDCADATADIRAELAAAGSPIGPYDVQIAGTARKHGQILVTNNVKEFERVPGLRVERWT